VLAEERALPTAWNCTSWFATTSSPSLPSTFRRRVFHHPRVGLTKILSELQVRTNRDTPQPGIAPSVVLPPAFSLSAPNPHIQGREAAGNCHAAFVPSQIPLCAVDSVSSVCLISVTSKGLTPSLSIRAAPRRSNTASRGGDLRGGYFEGASRAWGAAKDQHRPPSEWGLHKNLLAYPAQCTPRHHDPSQSTRTDTDM